MRYNLGEAHVCKCNPYGRTMHIVIVCIRVLGARFAFFILGVPGSTMRLVSRRRRCSSNTHVSILQPRMQQPPKVVSCKLVIPAWPSWLFCSSHSVQREYMYNCRPTWLSIVSGLANQTHKRMRGNSRPEKKWMDPFLVLVLVSVLIFFTFHCWLTLARPDLPLMSEARSMSGHPS